MWNFYYMSWVSCVYCWGLFFSQFWGFNSKNYAAFSVRFTSEVNVKKNSSSENGSL